MYAVYNVLLLLGAVVLVPYYTLRILSTGKYRKSIGPKLGFVPETAYGEMKGNPRVWIHAVSVGEVTAAAPVVASLRDLLPEACLVVSTSTETGQEMARRMIPEATSHIYYPLDIPSVVRKVVGRVKPDVFVLVETELWPNFIRLCKDAGAKIVMVNGRMSPRSFKRYRGTRFFWKKVLAMVDGIGVISETDAQRLHAVGVHRSRIQVLGNAKFDGLAARVDERLKKEISEELGLRGDERVFVAGSTHEGEEDAVLRVYKRLLERHPDFKLVIVPRHVERGGEVLSLVRKYGFEDVVSMSDIKKGQRPHGERVTVVDVIGELFKVYSLATVVFCGGSLVPRGGQNILEAAAWGKVVFYGPSMDDFRDEAALLEGVGAGITVKDEEELYAGIVLMLTSPEKLTESGKAGRRAVAANKGASKRYADMIKDVLANRTLRRG